MTTRPRLALVDAGLDWIGPIPAEWQVRRLGHYFDERRVKVSDKDFAPLSVTMKGVVHQLENVAKTDDGDNRKLVRSGDFVINSRSDRKGSGGIAPRDGSVSLINTVLATQAGMRSQFAAYLLTSYPFQEEFYRVGNGIVADMWTTKYREMKNIRLAVPGLPEQDAIVAYLDRATSRIDTLVAKKARFIELLGEKRQALITHAVTKGIDPNVEMKDSGAEWLGDIPATWDVMTLKRDTAFRTSGSRGWAEHYSDAGPIFIRIGNLSRGNFSLDLTDIVNVSPPEGAEGARTKVAPGDLLFSITAYLGSVGLVPEDLGDAFVSQHVALVRLNYRRLTSPWVAYFVLSNHGQTYLTTQSYGGTKMQLGLDDIGDLPIVVPPIDVQSTIVAHLDRATSRIDTLIAKTERSIELLREHRTALITAAVTGKIDLRPAA